MDEPQCAHADWGIVYARTGAPGRQAGDQRKFVVDADAPGLEKHPEVGMLTAFSPYVLHFDNVEWPRPT